MLEYKFYKNEIGTPQFFVFGDLEGLSELGSCDKEYLDEIILSLERVIEGIQNLYCFGFEVYTIECKKMTSKVINTFNNWKIIEEIPTKEVYEMMYSWRNYINQ